MAIRVAGSSVVKLQEVEFDVGRDTLASSSARLWGCLSITDLTRCTV